MCSNGANNRRRALSYYVTQVNGQNVDRRRIADPVLRDAGMPRMVRPAGQPLDGVLNEAPVQPANAVADEGFDKAVVEMITDGVSTVIATQVGHNAVRPAVYAAIPDFDPTATYKALAAHEAKRNRDAIKADREARRTHRNQIKKLRSHKSAKQDGQNTANVPKLERDNAEGFAAAQALLPANMPKKIFNFKGFKSYCSWYGHNPLVHELVKQKCYDNSTFVTAIDLRDDKKLTPNGETIRRGAIYEDGEVKASATKVSVEIFTEVYGNVERAITELERVTRYCPNLRSLGIEVLGSNSLRLAEKILDTIKQDKREWAANSRRLKITYKASRYDEDDE